MATRAPKGAARPRGGTTSRTRQAGSTARSRSGSSARNRRGPHTARALAVGRPRQVEGPPLLQAGAVRQSVRHPGRLARCHHRGRLDGAGAHGRRGQPRARPQRARPRPAAPPGWPRADGVVRGDRRGRGDLGTCRRADQAARHASCTVFGSGVLGGADPARPAGLAVPAASGQQRRHRADGDRLDRAARRRPRPGAHRVGHAGPVRGHAGHQVGGRPDRLRGLGAAGRPSSRSGPRSRCWLWSPASACWSSPARRCTAFRTGWPNCTGFRQRGQADGDPEEARRVRRARPQPGEAGSAADRRRWRWAPATVPMTPR